MEKPVALSVWFYQEPCRSKCIKLICSCGFLRAKLKLPQKTMSLWSWVNRPEELSRFQNPIYEANSLVIWPSVAPQSLQLWEGEPGLLSLLQTISLF